MHAECGIEMPFKEGDSILGLACVIGIRDRLLKFDQILWHKIAPIRPVLLSKGVIARQNPNEAGAAGVAQPFKVELEQSPLRIR